MDDVGPTGHTRGDALEKAPEAESVPWSCIDYVDARRRKGWEPTKESTARVVPGGRHLSERFGVLAGHASRREDNHGNCVNYNTGTGRILQRGCGPAVMTLAEGAGGGQRGSNTHQQWTGKQTNSGWPGTAEGKINTAQGMAGDLVSNLNSEEKRAVAGI